METPKPPQPERIRRSPRALLRHVLRRLKVLKYANYLLFVARYLQKWPENRRFLRRHPEFRPPPAWILFDATAHIHYAGYYRSGIESARDVAALIAKYASRETGLRVLEWGCGPARCLQHLRGLLPDATFTGTDYNARSIRWCLQNIPGIGFAVNEPQPPLPFGDASFDVVYAISVFTHLSEDNGRRWMAELKRVLADGGIIVFTTRGANYGEFFTAAERERFRNGGVVVVSNNVGEGQKYFLAHHSAAYTRSVLIPPFEELDHQPGQLNTPQQDRWVIRKPAPGGGRP
jgi:SAM-dependent methyltransferase